MKSVPHALWARFADLAALVATPLVPSHYIGLVRPLAATHARYARVEAVIDESADTRTLTLRPGRGWKPHRAGQYVRIGVEIDGRIQTRTYSISSAPERSDGCITITVKAQGKVSNALVRDVQVGSYLSIGLPDGEFVLPCGLGGGLPGGLGGGLPEGPDTQLGYITGGSGITPVMSMLRSLDARGELPDIAHVHFARSARDVIFGDELRTLALKHPRYRLTIVLTDADPRRLDSQRLYQLMPDWRARQTWACGPQSLLDTTTALFAVHHLSESLHVERFTASFAAAPSDAAGGNVRFSATGRDARSDGRTPLLRIAEEAGVQAPHGCRMGICHSCDTTLVSGCVRDLRTGERITEPGTRVQVCVCAAAGDVELAL
jgi:ferredoxin-NADP reductase